jgi:hypothetical protein
MPNNNITSRAAAQARNAQPNSKSGNQDKHWRAETLDQIDESRLPKATRLILRVFVKCCSAGRQYCWPSHKTIMKRSGTAESTVRCVLTDLIDNGVLPPPLWCSVEHGDRGRIIGEPKRLANQGAHGSGHIRLWDMSSLRAWLAAYADSERTGVVYVTRRQASVKRKADSFTDDEELVNASRVPLGAVTFCDMKSQPVTIQKSLSGLKKGPPSSPLRGHRSAKRGPPFSGEKGPPTIDVSQESSSISDSGSPPNLLKEYPNQNMLSTSVPTTPPSEPAIAREDVQRVFQCWQKAYRHPEVSLRPEDARVIAYRIDSCDEEGEKFCCRIASLLALDGMTCNEPLEIYGRSDSEFDLLVGEAVRIMKERKRLQSQAA